MRGEQLTKYLFLKQKVFNQKAEKPLTLIMFGAY